MKSLLSAAMALMLLSTASVASAQAGVVRFGSSLGAGIAVKLRSTVGLTLVYAGFPYVSGTAPLAYDRSFPARQIGATFPGLGGITAQNAFVRATSDVDGLAGSRFARGSSVVQNLVIQVGPDIRFTAMAINSATKTWGAAGRFYAVSSVTFQSAALDVFGNHVSLNDTVAPNLHVLNDKGVVVTANEQTTSGDGVSGLSRVTNALHIKFTNVPVNGQFVSGDIYVGRSYAQTKG